MTIKLVLYCVVAQPSSGLELGPLVCRPVNSAKLGLGHRQPDAQGHSLLQDMPRAKAANRSLDADMQLAKSGDPGRFTPLP